MNFDIGRCAIPTVYCGNKSPRDAEPGFGRRYTRKGTSHECLRIGFGAGKSVAESKGLPKTSLRKIRYIGEVYEQHLQEQGIMNIPGLKRYAKSHQPDEIAELLRMVLVRSNGVLDGRAYNSMLLWLYQQGISRLPGCEALPEP